eukprot:m.221620 g.221620  ORF g.221620 m.221620 type:complete len:384 (+) comp54168_c0_seq1:52-1203(+)
MFRVALRMCHSGLLHAQAIPAALKAAQIRSLNSEPSRPAFTETHTTTQAEAHPDSIKVTAHSVVVEDLSSARANATEHGSATGPFEATVHSDSSTPLSAPAPGLVDLATTRQDFEHAIQAHINKRPAHGHVAFVRHALQRMDALQVQPTVHTYNLLIHVFPEKNTFKNLSLLDALWYRETPQSECVLDILQRMEETGLIPESATHSALIQRFGAASEAVVKCRRLAYWMKRFAYSNPFLAPTYTTMTAQQKLEAVSQRIGGRAADVKDILEGSGVLGAVYQSQTPRQAELLRSVCGTAGSSVTIEGPHKIWVARNQISYLTLEANSPLITSPHQRVLACATVSHVNDEVISAWIRSLEAQFSGFSQLPLVVSVLLPTDVAETK